MDIFANFYSTVMLGLIIWACEPISMASTVNYIVGQSPITIMVILTPKKLFMRFIYLVYVLFTL